MTLLNHITIAIADDSPEFRTIIRLFLEYADDIVIVGEAKNGREVLDLLNHMLPDILLLDIRMPKMSGIEVLKHLQAQPSAMPKVIVMTAYESDFYQQQALNLGACGYITKGGTPEGLIQTIHDVVRLSG